MTPPVKSFKRAEELARRALEIDPSLPEAHMSLGEVLFNQWDFKGSEEELNRALELDPNSATVLSDKANLMLFRGRLDEAATLARRALELDPLSPSILNNAATILLYSGKLDDAITLFKKVLEIDPEAASALCNLGVAYVQKGMLDEGIDSIRDAIRMSKGSSPGQWSDLGHALSKAGRFAELRELLIETLEWHAKNHRGAIALVSLYANLGDKDKAFEWLEKAIEEHSGYLNGILADFAFEDLRSDPRMEAIIARLGLR